MISYGRVHSWNLVRDSNGSNQLEPYTQGKKCKSIDESRIGNPFSFYRCSFIGFKAKTIVSFIANVATRSFRCKVWQCTWQPKFSCHLSLLDSKLARDPAVEHYRRWLHLEPTPPSRCNAICHCGRNPIRLFGVFWWSDWMSASSGYTHQKSQTPESIK